MKPDAKAPVASGTLGAEIALRIDELAALSDEPGRLTRLYLGPAHRRAIDLVSEWMRAAGMTVRLDATGTLIGRYEGAAPDAPALLIGSHIDTVRDAGRFDGNLGVITGIAVVGRLHASGRRPSFAVEVVAFGDEEGVRFPSTLGGSRALAGRFEPRLLDEVDAEGVSRRQALERFGCDPAEISAAVRAPASTLGYVEVHIEQGPVLEAEGLPMGVVTAINGASRGSVTVTGISGHAGTMPMQLRRDALAAAAEMIAAIERRGRQVADLVATVGRLEVAGAATNTIPGRVTFSLDVRHPADHQRTAAIRDIESSIKSIAAARGIEVEVTIDHDAPAAPADAGLSERLGRAVAHIGVPVRRLPSGAGHDAMAFGGAIPFAMLFVRCRDGISHNPAEYASPADIDLAARALADFVDRWDREAGQ